ncbi:MAG: hypothetical protein C0504_06120 [Candidatus Solibacter sp.]|nr:hypothetical protein [Candidatus Solibacter sp.]
MSRQIVAVNGAEWMELEARARAAGMTMPQYLRSICGLPAKGIVTNRAVVHEPSRARQPVNALERRTITVPLTLEERALIQANARQVGVRSAAQYIRSRAGLQIRNTSLPGTAEREDEEDDAWNRLRQLNLDPTAFFER